MAKTQPTHDLRGLLVPEAGTLTATYTATSQAGPRAGAIVPDQVTGLSLYGSGALDANSQAALGGDMILNIAAAGSVGTAQCRWRFDGEVARNYDPPVMMAGWEYIDRTTTASRYRYPHIVRRAETGLLAVVSSYNTNDLRVHAQGTTGKWTVATLATSGFAAKACLVDMPSGRLLALYVVPASTAGASTQIRMAYSDDDGATWTTGSDAVLPSAIGVAPSAIQRIRAVELGGQIAMLIHYVSAGVDVIYQYASRDGGGTFATIEAVGLVARGFPDLAVSQGSIYVALLRYDASFTPVTIRPYVYRLASASQPVTSSQGVNAATGAGNAVFGSYAGTAFTAGELAILATDDGTLYLYGVDFSGGGTGEVITRVSVDRGATWDQNFRNSRGVVGGTVAHYSGSASTAWRDLSVAPERGRAVLAHTYIGTVVNDYTSLCAAYLGGWSTVGMPAPGDQDAWEVAGWDDSYVPMDLPDDAGPTWTRTLTGSATEALGDAGVTVTATGADRLFYTTAPVTTGYLEDGILCEVRVVATSGTSAIDLRVCDGTDGYRARVEITTTGVTLSDVGGGAFTATTAVDATLGIVVRIALGKATGAWSTNVGRVRAWVRVDGPYTGGAINHGPRQDREWTQIGTSSTLQSIATAANRIAWGALTAAATSTWGWNFWSAGRETAGNILTSATGTTRGHVVPSSASPVHVTDGLRVHGVDGPTVQGDSFRTRADYEYPVSAINPAVSPSPRRRWRSTSDAQQDIILTGVSLGARSGDLYGLYLAGCNWRTATLYRDSSATNKVCDIDLGAGMSALDFTRSRGLVYPVAGAGGGMPFYASAQRLAGATVEYTQAVGPTVVAREVRDNTSGAWIGGSATGTYAAVRIDLDAFEAGDPTTGQLNIRMPSAVILFDALVGTDTLMLRIPGQVTPNDYFSIGTMIVGRVRLFGRQYSRGRGLTFTPAYELTETRSGTRRARRLGPTRRAMEMAWDDGIDTTGLNTAGTAPDYYGLGYSGADGLTAIADTGRTLAGLIEQTDGAVLPVVVLPAIPQQSSAPGTTGLQLLNPEAHLYGRILTETLRVDSDASVRGQELRDPGEVVQVSTVIVEEEL
jgi:hypothetical protein